MADWLHPVLSDSYSSVLTTHLTGRDLDSITLCNTDPTNIPEHAIKYNRASNKFQERIGGVWIDLVLALVGGGTGANSASSARFNLGLGTLAIQNASAVAITGGTITGVSIPASDIGSGAVALNRGGTGSSLALGAAGTFLRSNGVSVEFSNDGSSFTSVGVPVGTMIMWPGGTFPTGWFQCDGTAVSRVTYANLFAVIGTTYGVGNGTTTFNLPDLKDRFPVGNGINSLFNALNKKGGSTANHVHNYSGITSFAFGTDIHFQTGTSLAPTRTSSHDHTFGGQTGDNIGTTLPPFIVLNFLIKW